MNGSTAYINDECTVDQVRHELEQLGLKTNGRKNTLVKRLSTHQSAEPTQQISEPKPTKRRQTVLEPLLEGSPKRQRTVLERSVEIIVKENGTENEMVFEESISDRRLSHLIEWERKLQQREKAIREEEQRLSRHRQLIEPFVQPISGESSNHRPFKLALCTIGLRDIIEILPEFDPNNRSGIDARQFVQRISILKQAYDWEDGLVVLAVPAKLRGYAKMWADTQRNIYQRWDDFAADLLKNFPNHRLERDVHIELSITRRNVNEKLTGYYYRMCAIACRARIHDAATVKYIRNGLNHMGIRNVLAGLSFGTCLELFAFLDHYEEILPSNDSECGASATEPPLERPRNDRRCYNCKEFGHLSFNCPKFQRRIRCCKCKRPGHAACECPETDRPPGINSGNSFIGRSQPTKQEGSTIHRDGTSSGMAEYNGNP